MSHSTAGEDLPRVLEVSRFAAAREAEVDTDHYRHRYRHRRRH